MVGMIFLGLCYRLYIESILHFLSYQIQLYHLNKNSTKNSINILSQNKQQNIKVQELLYDIDNEKLNISKLITNWLSGCIPILRSILLLTIFFFNLCHCIHWKRWCNKNVELEVIDVKRSRVVLVISRCTSQCIIIITDLYHDNNLYRYLYCIVIHNIIFLIYSHYRFISI